MCCNVRTTLKLLGSEILSICRCYLKKKENRCNNKEKCEALSSHRQEIGHLLLLASRSMCLTFASVFHYRRRWPSLAAALSRCLSPAVSNPLSSVTPHLRSEGSASSICLRRKKKKTDLMLFCEKFQVRSDGKPQWLLHTHPHTLRTRTNECTINLLSSNTMNKNTHHHMVR